MSAVQGWPWSSGWGNQGGAPEICGVPTSGLGGQESRTNFRGQHTKGIYKESFFVPKDEFAISTHGFGHNNVSYLFYSSTSRYMIVFVIVKPERELCLLINKAWNFLGWSVFLLPCTIFSTFFGCCGFSSVCKNQTMILFWWVTGLTEQAEWSLYWTQHRLHCSLQLAGLDLAVFQWRLGKKNWSSVWGYK